MKLGKVTKIYIGWSIIITLGVGAFALARTSVSKNRYKVMKAKESIRNQTRIEQEQSNTIKSISN